PTIRRIRYKKQKISYISAAKVAIRFLYILRVLSVFFLKLGIKVLPIILKSQFSGKA
ncbi:hypothetical protein JHW43_008177, partial [Diplocarpon mali]